MKNKKEIEDSLDFCKQIKYYETDEKHLQFDSNNFPRLKEYLHWVKDTDASVHNDVVDFDKILEHSASSPQAIEEDKIIQQILLNDPEHGKNTKSKDTRFRFADLIQILLCIVISYIIVLSFTTFVATHTRVKGPSMENTLHSGDYLIIDRFSYHFNDPKQFDIIVFEHTQDTNYIKRVIATPGQTVQIVDGTIYVDDQVVNETYGKEKIEDPGLANEKITLGEDEYFVMGDNRNESTDSRSPLVGLIKREDIIGKVLIRIYPFDQMGSVDE